DERRVDVDDAPAAGGEFLADAHEEFLRVDVLVGGVRVRKKMTDVGQAGGAEQGVANGVGEAVGVGVAVEADVALEGDAAEHHGATGSGAVNVVAVADAKVHVVTRSRSFNAESQRREGRKDSSPAGGLVTLRLRLFALK